MRKQRWDFKCYHIDSLFVFTFVCCETLWLIIYTCHQRLVALFGQQRHDYCCNCLFMAKRSIPVDCRCFCKLYQSKQQYRESFGKFNWAQINCNSQLGFQLKVFILKIGGLAVQINFFLLLSSFQCYAYNFSWMD